MRLYDATKGRWDWITVDNLEPVGCCGTVSASSKDGELWPMILERAFAKWTGSYAAINGGMQSWAYTALTGYPAAYFENDDHHNKWNQVSLISGSAIVLQRISPNSCIFPNQQVLLYGPSDTRLDTCYAMRGMGAIKTDLQMA